MVLFAKEKGNRGVQHKGNWTMNSQAPMPRRKKRADENASHKHAASKGKRKKGLLASCSLCLVRSSYVRKVDERLEDGSKSNDPCNTKKNLKAFGRARAIVYRCIAIHVSCSLAVRASDSEQRRRPQIHASNDEVLQRSLSRQTLG